MTLDLLAFHDSKKTITPYLEVVVFLLSKIRLLLTQSQ